MENKFKSLSDAFESLGENVLYRGRHERLMSVREGGLLELSSGHWVSFSDCGPVFQTAGLAEPEWTPVPVPAYVESGYEARKKFIALGGEVLTEGGVIVFRGVPDEIRDTVHEIAYHAGLREGEDYVFLPAVEASVESEVSPAIPPAASVPEGDGGVNSGSGDVTFENL